MGKCSCPHDCHNIYCSNKDELFDQDYNNNRDSKDSKDKKDSKERKDSKENKDNKDVKKQAPKKASSSKNVAKNGSDKVSKNTGSNKKNSASQFDGTPLKCMNCPDDCDDECARIREAYARLNASTLENCIRDLISRILVCLRALLCVPLDEINPVRRCETVAEPSNESPEDDQTKLKDKKKKRVSTALFTNKFILKRNSKSSPNMNKIHRVNSESNKFFSNKIKRIRSLYHLPKHRMQDFYNKLFCENLADDKTPPCLGKTFMPQHCRGCRCGCDL